MEIEHSERVEAELDRLIEKHPDQRRMSEGERRAEDLWQESIRRFNARRQQDLRSLWCEHYRKMRVCIRAWQAGTTRS